MRLLLLVGILTATQTLAQQAPGTTKTTEQQARSYIASAFMTGAAPNILSDSVAVTPELRQRLRVAEDADSRAVYRALVGMTVGKTVQVRPAAGDEIAQSQPPSSPERAMFVLEVGDASLILQYDLERDHVSFMGLPSAVATAAPVAAPVAPQPMAEAPKPGLVEEPKPEAVAAPTPVEAPKPVETPKPAAEEAPAAPAVPVQVVEPQVPRAAKPAPRPVPPTTTAAARMPQEPPLRRSGPCEIKPVMSDQDLVNCGATPPRY